MNRAEFRRIQKQKNKKYTLTQGQIDKIKKDSYREAVDVAFTLMLAVPTNILTKNYWEKTAAKRIPKFLDECIKVYENIGRDNVTIKGLMEETEKIGKIKFSDLREVYK